MQRINITLPEKLVSDLRRTIPERSRSKFISEAVEEKLAKKKNLKRDLIKSLKASYQSDKELMEDWAAIETEGWPD